MACSGSCITSQNVISVPSEKVWKSLVVFLAAFYMPAVPCDQRILDNPAANDMIFFDRHANQDGHGQSLLTAGNLMPFSCGQIRRCLAGASDKRLTADASRISRPRSRIKSSSSWLQLNRILIDSQLRLSILGAWRKKMVRTSLWVFRSFSFRRYNRAS
jgi:hypothetical protein